MAVYASWLYAVLASVVALFQLALALGRPWGHLAMGGQFPGVLPGAMRAAAVGQGLLLVAMALAVLARAEALGWRGPEWVFWASVAITLTTMVLNLITPSAPERLLWGPVTVVMVICVLVVAVQTTWGAP